ncbi:exodeoxyribonuclease VII large subunit [Elioraea rosea]|uniref:exodeoxyribonuclease VII large subunit n=1 Tax=Elioraea rosea TaxID=2492390 RepID=UPI001181F357|nr:exodeoxyribonuclease VII large subunit [Elioraea rosea]
MQEIAPPAAAERPNIPEFSVSEIAGAVKRALEDRFGRVRVRGEITECKRYPSGHIYLSLKDENAKLAAVIWKSVVPRLGLDPENGVEVVATGKLTTYADRSSYQLQIDRLDYAGAGALLARIEMLKQRLAAEGLFAAERKRPIPRLPRVIGVVTSPRGAVIRDILHRLAERFPRHVLVWPVAVQGQGAAEQVAAAIAGFNALEPGGAVPRPDVLIVARGGGSLEDLMAFNEEAVVRAAAASAIPLISAVGHETDTTLIDFVSDRRAPTPTAAAEMAVPVRLDVLREVKGLDARLAGGLARTMNERRLRLERAARAVPDLPSLLATARQRLDDRSARLDAALPGFVQRRRLTLASLAGRLPHPREGVAARRNALSLLAQRLPTALSRLAERRHLALARIRLSDQPVRAALAQGRTRLEALSARLEGASYQAVLSRGFALVTDADGHAVTRAASVAPGARLDLRFADGPVRATADGVAPRKASPAKPEQGSLL